MERIQHTLPLNRLVILFLVLINAIIIKTGFTDSAGWYWWLLLTIPLLVIAILNIYRAIPGNNNTFYHYLTNKHEKD